MHNTTRPYQVPLSMAGLVVMCFAVYVMVGTSSWSSVYSRCDLVFKVLKIRLTMRFLIHQVSNCALAGPRGFLDIKRIIVSLIYVLFMMSCLV